MTSLSLYELDAGLGAVYSCPQAYEQNSAKFLAKRWKGPQGPQLGRGKWRVQAKKQMWGTEADQILIKTTKHNRKEQNHMIKKLLIAGAALCLAAGLSAKAADAKENWSANCTKCHGEDGKGETKMGKKAGAKDYTKAEVQAEMKDDAAFKAIKEGMKEGDKEVMKPYGDKLSDDEIKALVAYMRTLKK